MADGFYKELHRSVGAAVLANKIKYMSVKQVSRAVSMLQEGEEDLEPALTKADVRDLIKKHDSSKEVQGNITVTKAEQKALPKGKSELIMKESVVVNGITYHRK